MIGSIIGDIVGSVYEFNNIKSKDFPLFIKESIFTDDTVMTVAVADFISDEHGNSSQSRFVSFMHKWYKRYPKESYGGTFIKWINQFDKVRYTDFKPYNSYGNGSAMKISPIADALDSVEAVNDNAKFITEVSHNHPEGIKGAQAVAMLTVLSRSEKNKEKLKKQIVDRFGYDLDRTVDELRETYIYNETCQRTVPEAIICFLESKDFEDAIRNAISIGGDSDTLACITGGIAEAYYQKIPEWILKEAINRLPEDILAVVFHFYERIGFMYPEISKILLDSK